MATAHVAVDRQEWREIHDLAEQVVRAPVSTRLIALAQMVLSMDVYSMPAVVEQEIRAGNLRVSVLAVGEHTGPVHT